MKSLVCLAILALVSCGANRSLIPAIAPLRVLPVGPPERQQADNAQQQGNASSATKDNSGTSGDQITKPAGAKESTLIGCLTGPNEDGKYTLRSMNHRTGVEILGPDNLKKDSGTKVKLTGNWQPPQPEANTTANAATSPANGKVTAPVEMRRFQVTDVEVVAKTCSMPTEVTPQSKNKKPKATIYQAPPADDNSK
jgi:hypothetical protein